MDDPDPFVKSFPAYILFIFLSKGPMRESAEIFSNVDAASARALDRFIRKRCIIKDITLCISCMRVFASVSACGEGGDARRNREHVRGDVRV